MWGRVLAHVLRFITPNCISDIKMEKQSIQNLVNIITIITDLLFFHLHFLNGMEGGGVSKECTLVVLRKKKTSMTAWRYL